MSNSNGMSHLQEETMDTILTDSATVTGSPETSNFLPTTLNLKNAEFPRTIPESHPARTLVLCFDGTGDQFDSDNSNIVEFFAMLKKDDRSQQMVYYQAGIGTYTSPEIATPLAAKMSKTLDEMIAWNLHSHVMDGYEFLMQNYEAGDRICIFGFSRGAYTARGLAGMIHKVGLLPACNYQQVPFAYKMFTRTDETGWKQSNAFKKAFSVDITIEFIGVWDTVNSVGLIPHSLPFTTSNTIVHTFRHAVSLDERRAKFKANLWNRPNEHEKILGIKGQTPEEPKVAYAQKRASHDFERQYSINNKRETDIEEVWFSGCHCDVGGGSVDNDTPHSLARIPLRWMVRECFKTGTGILFTSEGIRKAGIDPASLYPTVTKRPPPLLVDGCYIQRIALTVPIKPELPHYTEVGDLVQIANVKSEEEHELHDAMSPIYDQLSISWFWWILELIPLRRHYQKGNNTWVNNLSINFGQGRFIPKQKSNGVKVHRSVKLRMEAQYLDGKKYVPQASFQQALELGKVEWVD